jgi:hypothetical protein
MIHALQDSVRIQSNRQKKCCSTKKETERPTSMKTEQAISGLYPDAAVAVAADDGTRITANRSGAWSM